MHCIHTATMKLRTTVTSLSILAIFSLATPLFGQEQAPSPKPISDQDAKVLARVSSQEGIPTSPELRSQLNRSVELGEFGRIAYRAPMNNAKTTPIVLFHYIYGGVSHRDYRELLPLLDQAGAPVYIVDLPGVGQSDKPKTRYTLDTLDRFINQFLVQVVGRPAHVVAAGTTTLSALSVAAQHPDLVKSLVLISPTGVKQAASPPSPERTAAYDQLFQTDDAATWVNLLTPEVIRSFDQSESVFSQPAFLAANGDRLVEERLIQRSNLGQRWISYAFIFGQLFRPFAEASAEVKVPVLGIFGDDYKTSQGPDGPPIVPETAADFQQIRPEFKYLEVPNARLSVQREQPDAVAQAIINFSCHGDCRK
jgi:pimeloyl-ACP methyl ester carboxylesterase